MSRPWDQPHFALDVAAGSAEGFSLEGLQLQGIHFVTVSAGSADR